MNLENCIIDKGMAKAFTAEAIGQTTEEMGVSLPPKTEIMDLFSGPTKTAVKDSYRLAGAIEALSKMSVLSLLYKAAKADGMDPYTDSSCITAEYAEDFGHYLAMESLGHGVSWFDDHAEFELNIPDSWDSATRDDPKIVEIITARFGSQLTR